MKRVSNATIFVILITIAATHTTLGGLAGTPLGKFQKHSGSSQSTRSQSRDTSTEETQSEQVRETEAAAQQRTVAQANQANEEGVAREKSGDLEGAVEKYALAASLSPLDQTIQKNLANARLALNAQKERQQAAQRKAAEDARQSVAAHTALDMLVPAIPPPTSGSSSGLGTDLGEALDNLVIDNEHGKRAAENSNLDHSSAWARITVGRARPRGAPLDLKRASGPPESVAVAEPDEYRDNPKAQEHEKERVVIERKLVQVETDVAGEENKPNPDLMKLSVLKQQRSNLGFERGKAIFERDEAVRTFHIKKIEPEPGAEPSKRKQLEGQAPPVPR